MIYRASAMLVTAACVAVPALAQFCAPLEAGLQEVDCNGNSYTINVPQQCVVGGGECGMIFGAHGFSQNPDEQDSSTNMRALGEEYGYVVVQPQGNPLQVSIVRLPGFSEVDDGNIYQTLLDLRDDFEIDPARIHFGGFSQGSWLTWRIACNQAGLTPEPRTVIASFGPMSAGIDGNNPLGGGSADTCFGPNDIGGSSTAILHIHGRDDNVVPFSEAENAVEDISEAMGVDAIVEVLESNDFYERTRREGNGLIYETIFHEEGHCVVGPSDCNGDPSFLAGEEQIAFYMAHPLAVEPDMGGGGTSINTREPVLETTTTPVNTPQTPDNAGNQIGGGNGSEGTETNAAPGAVEAPRMLSYLSVCAIAAFLAL